MANTTYEGPGKIYFENNLLAEASRVRVQITGNNRRVRTMKKGLAGRSRGAVESEITVDNAVPLDGLEADFVRKCVFNEDVVIVVDLAGQRQQYDGWIDSTESEQSVDNEASFSFTAVAGPPRLR